MKKKREIKSILENFVLSREIKERYSLQEINKVATTIKGKRLLVVQTEAMQEIHILQIIM